MEGLAVFASVVVAEAALTETPDHSVRTHAMRDS
jgi:hypothetical protein